MSLVIHAGGWYYDKLENTPAWNRNKDQNVAHSLYTVDISMFKRCYYGVVGKGCTCHAMKNILCIHDLFYKFGTQKRRAGHSQAVVMVANTKTLWNRNESCLFVAREYS